MYQYCRQPVPAGIIAALTTYIYLTLRTRINGEERPNKYFMKPAFLVGVLVFFIVRTGQSEAEPIIKDTRF